MSNSASKETYVQLEDIMRVRELRVLKKQELLTQYHCTVIGFTMNIPGPEKSSPEIDRTFQIGMRSLKCKLDRMHVKVLFWKEELFYTGPEGYFAVDDNPKTIKQYAVELEEEAVFGRLYDIDVHRMDGSMISRSDIGHTERKCFICGGNAKQCGRSRRHSLPELRMRVQQMLESYKGVDL